MLTRFPYINEIVRFITDRFYVDPEYRIHPEELGGVKIHFINESAEQMFNPDSLRPILNKTMQHKSRPDSDFVLSDQLHSILRDFAFDRRVAANMAVWDYMTVFHFKDYVVWRFPGRGGGKTPKTRLAGGNLGDNALSRLWFWADMTYDSEATDPYYLTRDTSLMQESIQYALDTRLPNNHTLLRCILQCISERNPSDKQVVYLFKRLRIHNATVKLRSMEQAQLLDYVNGIIDSWTGDHTN